MDESNLFLNKVRTEGLAKARRTKDDLRMYTASWTFECGDATVSAAIAAGTSPVRNSANGTWSLSSTSEDVKFLCAFASVAPAVNEFSQSNTYAVGDLVYRTVDGVRSDYVCWKPITMAMPFNGNFWKNITVGDAVQTYKDAACVYLVYSRHVSGNTYIQGSVVAKKVFTDSGQSILDGKQDKINITSGSVVKCTGNGTIAAATASDIPGLSGKRDKTDLSWPSEWTWIVSADTSPVSSPAPELIEFANSHPDFLEYMTEAGVSGWGVNSKYAVGVIPKAGGGFWSWNGLISQSAETALSVDAIPFHNDDSTEWHVCSASRTSSEDTSIALVSEIPTSAEKAAWTEKVGSFSAVGSVTPTVSSGVADLSNLFTSVDTSTDPAASGLLSNAALDKGIVKVCNSIIGTPNATLETALGTAAS